MKRLLFAVSAFFLALATFVPAPARAGDPGEISVLVDGLPVAFDVSPVIRDGRTLVPFRALAGALNVKVDWNGETRTVSAGRNQTSLVLTIGGSTARLNGSPLPLDAAPVILEGRTMIPARIFSEAFGCRVDWDGPARTVKIYSPTSPMEVTGFYALGDSRTSSWTNLFGKVYPATGPGNTGSLSRLALGWYSLDREGSLLTRSRTGWQRPESWEDVLKAARDYNLNTEMVVHLTDGEGAISALLSNQPAMDRAAGGIVKEAGLYRGVNLDFEGLGWQEEGDRLAATRDKFTAFVRLLSGRLRASGLELTLTLHAPNSAYRGYDYRALGTLADRVIVMAYDYGPFPEPPDQVIRAVEAARAGVPPEKLVLGISAPGETAESIPGKAGIAKRYGLKGVALWRLGLVPEEMWKALANSVRALK